MMIAALGVGDDDRALGWAEEAFERRDGLLPAVDPWLISDAIRDDPRFQAAVRRMKFPRHAAD